MGFIHNRGSHIYNASASGGLSITMAAAPSLGDIVCVALVVNAAITSVVVSDGNSNVYQVTSGSPSTFQSGAGQVWLAYLLSAPSNASATINITWSGVVAADIWAEDFSVTGGTASFDKDAKANTGTAGTTINTPSLSPAGTGELFFAAAAAGGTISAPAAGGTLGSWTGAAGGIGSNSGDDAEYSLSVNSALAVQFTQTSGSWSAMSMAFKFTPAVTTVSANVFGRHAYGSEGYSGFGNVIGGG